MFILRLGKWLKRATRNGTVQNETLPFSQSLALNHQQSFRAPYPSINAASLSMSHQFTCLVLSRISGVRANRRVPSVRGHSVTLLSRKDRLERCWVRGSVELHRLRSWTARPAEPRTRRRKSKFAEVFIA